jgi:hypothetical protein
MSRGIARRRADKAARRKKVLAERRKVAQVETMMPLAGRMRRLATLPLHACLMQEGLFERGNGTVILARRIGHGTLIMAAFLVDTWCLGVKDVFVREGEIAEMEAFIDSAGSTAPFASVDPSYARKLLRDLVAWARSLGFAPHADYAAAELLFGDSAAEACDVVFHFGREGKPLYMPGPGETPAQVRRRLEHLRRHRGDDGFDSIVPVEGAELDKVLETIQPLPPYGEEDGFDDDLEGEDGPGYDPAEAPDPTGWLALDEDERINRVEEYHRQAGIALPNEPLHAVMHTVVENQLAHGTAPVCRAVERLMAEDLSRHEALHAVASVLSDHLYDLTKAHAPKAISNEAYFAALDQLTAQSWRRKYQPDDEPDRPEQQK